MTWRALYESPHAVLASHHPTWHAAADWLRHMMLTAGTRQPDLPRDEPFAWSVGGDRFELERVG